MSVETGKDAGSVRFDGKMHFAGAAVSEDRKRGPRGSGA